MTTALSSVQVPALAALPGLVHGFERPGPGRERSRAAAREQAAAALGDAGRLLFLHQVHGNAVRRAPWDGCPEGDAAMAGEAGLLLGIETADCLPILLVDPRRRRVAAAHAGWRGSAAGVARAAVEALAAAGSAPADLLAALGPSIGPCCYEVGEEVRGAFGPAAAAAFQAGPRGRPHLDLRSANRAQLLACGVPAERVHVVDECTACRTDLYPSYRRDGRGCGRLISFVGFAR